MNRGVKYVKVVVVVPGGAEYDVEVNPAINDADLLREIVSNPDFNLDEGEAGYKLRKVHRTGDGKIKDNSVIVLDLARQGNLGRVNRRD